MKVSELLRKHLSDKVTHHNYADTYDRLLEPIKDTATHVLELGVMHGQSLKAWKEFFPNAEIWGIDNDVGRLNGIIADYMGDFKLFLMDTTSRDHFIAVTKDWPQFDFICDDASHVPVEQFFALIVLWKQLKPGGIYVCEDIPSPEVLQMFSIFPGAELLDLRAGGKCKDDLMAVICKPA